MFQNIATVIVLIICSYVDIRQRKVEKRIAGIYAAAVLAGRLAEGQFVLAGELPSESVRASSEPDSPP